MKDINYLKIGIIKKPHGIRGELKVLPLTDNPGRYKKLKQVFIGPGQAVEQNDYNSVKEYKIERLRVNPSEVVLKVEGCDSRDQAGLFRGCYILIDRKFGEKLGTWEFYSQDLIGCDVYFDGQIIGKVFNLLNTGANDNLEIKTTAGKEIVYPFLRQFITSVDIDGKKIEINDYEGFFT